MQLIRLVETLINLAPCEDKIIKHVKDDRVILPIMNPNDFLIDCDRPIKNLDDRVNIAPRIEGHVEHGRVGESPVNFANCGTHALRNFSGGWIPNIIGAAVQDDHLGIEAVQLAVHYSPQTIFNPVAADPVVDGAQWSIL